MLVGDDEVDELVEDELDELEAAGRVDADTAGDVGAATDERDTELDVVELEDVELEDVELEDVTVRAGSATMTPPAEWLASVGAAVGTSELSAPSVLFRDVALELVGWLLEG